MSNAAIEFENLSFRYQPHSPWVIEDYRGIIEKGSIVSVMGTNGRGKTTLLKLWLSALKPCTGRVRVDGKIAFVPQLFQVTFPYRVLDMVLMGRARKIGLFSQPSRDDKGAALAALARLGLEAIADKPFDSLSGGQRQLVMIARALASEATILVLDEPTSALDLKNQKMVLRCLTQLARENHITIIFTTHNPQHAWEISTQTLLMLGTKNVLLGATSEVLSSENLIEVFGLPVQKVNVVAEGELKTTLTPVF